MKPKLNKKCGPSKKVIYSEPAANRAVQKVEGAVRYYKCDDCKGFHITSMETHEQMEQSTMSRGLYLSKRRRLSKRKLKKRKDELNYSIRKSKQK